MKRRRCSRIVPDDPSPIGASFPRGFHGVRSSEARSDTTASRHNQEVGCIKKVRFANVDNQTNLEASRPLDPKTSEYTFYKKLKEDAGHRFTSWSLVQDKSLSKVFQSKRTFVAKNSNKDFNSSLSIANVTPNNSVSIFTPLDNASKKSGTYMERADTVLGDIHSLQKNGEDYENKMRHRGDQYRPREFFSRKRQKLWQLVADTSLPEIEELYSKGYDLVSLLLSRLFPESDEDKVDTNSKFKSFTSPKSDVHFKKSHWMPSRNSMEVEYGESLDDDGVSSCWMEVPEERQLTNVGTLTSHSHETYLDNRRKDTDYKFGEKATSILCIKGAPTFGFCNERNTSLSPSHHFNEFDEFHHPDQSLCGRKPHKLLLDWDSDQLTDDKILSASRQHTELTTYPISSTSPAEELNLDNRFSLSELCAPPLLSFHAPNVCPVQYSPSASYGSYKFREHFLEIKDDIVAVLNGFPLPSSCTSNYRNLAEYSNCETTSKGGNIFLPPQNHLWFMSKILNEEHHHPITEARFTSGLDFNLGQKCFSLNGSSPRDSCLTTSHALEFPRNEGTFSNLAEDEYENCPNDPNHEGFIRHCGDDVINIHDRLSPYFELDIDEKKAWPLLLDKSRWDGSEGEMHSDDCEVNYF